MIHPSQSVLIQPSVDFLSAARRYLKARTGKQYSAMEIDYIVSLYADICTSGGVDVEFALAQMSHETGGLTSAWSAPDKKNPAGIGVTGASGPDGQPLGLVFATWADAVEAHVGLILCYAFAAGQGNLEQQRLINEMLGHRPTAPRAVGKTVAELAAKWAADTTYISKLSAMHDAMRAA